MFARKGADAVADAVLARGKVVLARADLLLDQLAPVSGVQTAGGGGPRDGDGRRGHGHARQHLDGEGSAGTPDQCPRGRSLGPLAAVREDRKITRLNSS